MRLTKQDIEDLARDTLDQYGLSDVIFRWDNSKRRFGKARSEFDYIYGRYWIPVEMSLSWPLCQAAKSDDAIMDTILHEVAHLLHTKRTHLPSDHGPEWKRICVEIGADPSRCYDSAIIDNSKLRYKYTASCPDGCTFGFSRMGKAWARGSKRCRKHWNKLEIVQNY